MGVYERTDSPFYWMHCERPGARPLKRSTKIPVMARSTIARKQQREAAEDVYRAAMTDLARTRHKLPTAAPTLTRSFQTFSLWYEQHHTARKRGQERERYALAPLRDFFGSDDLTTITQPRAQEYLTHRLKATVSAATANREVDVLKSILREAVSAGHIDVSPLIGMKRLRVVPPRKRVLSQDEETRLLKALEPDDRALYLVAVDTLMRLSNVLDLARANDKGTHLELDDSKTGPYTVPLSTRARKALDSLPKNGAYFFTRRRSVKQPRNGIRLMLKYACQRAAVPYGRAAAGVTFHTATRATGATRMIRAGVDPKTVQEIGHWASFDQMGVYLHTDMAAKRAAVNQIGPVPVTSQERGKRKARKVQ